MLWFDLLSIPAGLYAMLFRREVTRQALQFQKRVWRQEYRGSTKAMEALCMLIGLGFVVLGVVSLVMELT